MWTPIACVTAFLVICLFADGLIDIILFITQALQSKRTKSIPGPYFKWPLVGHRPLVTSKGGLAKATLSLSKELNSEVVSLHLGGETSVTACTPQTVKEVLTKPEFQGRPHNYFTYLRSMKTNKGITMTDGELWQEQRAFVVKQLSEVGFGKDLMNTMIEDSLKTILKNLGEGGTDINLSSVISKSVINILWRIVTGNEIPESTLSELTRLMIARSKAFDMGGGWLAQLPWIRYIFPDWSGYNIVMKINRQIKKIITGTIDEHKADYKADVTRDLIDAYLHKMNDTSSQNSTFTDDQLMMVCLDLFIGGMLTTSTSLDFCFLRMIHHGDVQAKVQAELDSVLGNKLPTVEDRTRLPYMKAVINECLRITTLIPVTGPRRTLRSVLLGRYIVPKDTTVFINMSPVTMDPQKFPDPELFLPERFLDFNENDDNNFSQQAYSFGFGKRRCPGEVLARNYMFVVLAGLLHQFHVAAPHRKTVPTLQPNPGIIRTPQPFTLSLAKRIRIRPFSDCKSFS